MASIKLKKREAGKLNKRYLTLDEKFKMLDEVRKIKLSYTAIAEEFKIVKTQATNVVKNEAKFRKEFENFQGKGCKLIKRENYQKFKSFFSWFKKCEASAIYVNRS